MAKSKSSNTSMKTTFGKRKGGKPRKSKGPKDKNRKQYRGQGGL
jgi:hypothetical protein